MAKIAIASKIKGFSVSQPDLKPTPAVLQNAAQSPDRRIQLKSTHGELQKLVRWSGRPETPNGAISKTFRVNHPLTPFGVTVAQYDNGISHPFEVTLGYADKPRGLDATAKLLSVAMRMRDPKWVARLLDSLKNTEAESFEFAAPPTGNKVLVPSATAAMAMIVEHRCNELGYFADLADKDSPMLSAMTSESEPQTMGDGGTAKYWDVHNANSGDKFKVFITEVQLENGDILPYSIWFAGRYPAEFDGLARVLSYAMRISDLWWLDLCLKKLDGFKEPGGDFWAPMAGHKEKRAMYLSSIDYIAKLLRARYQALGLFDQEGRAVRQRPLFVIEGGATTVAALQSVATKQQPQCPSCHEHSLVLMDGCWTCTQPGCGHSKCG